MTSLQLESELGIRPTFQFLPTSQEQLEEFQVPLSVHVTPLKTPIEGEELIGEDQMVICPCGAYFNHFSQINYNANTFTCPFCSQQTKLPLSVLSFLANQQTPPQIASPVIEYSFTAKPNQPKNSFVFVIDTCCSENNLNSLKNALLKLTEDLNFDHTQICVLAFNKNIQVYRRTNGGALHSTIFDTTQNQTKRMNQLGIQLKEGKLQTTRAIEGFYFISDKTQLCDIFESLENDFVNTPQDERPQRATGLALEIAIDILTYSFLPASRVVLFTSGPCTIGEGTIASLKMAEFIRKQLDFEENKELKERSDKATAFYNKLSQRMIGLKSCLDIFGFSLDQFGLYEMRNLARSSGGLVVLNEEFVQPHFEQNLMRIFKKNSQGNTDLHQGAQITVKISSQLKICGALGNMSSLKTNKNCQGENKIGECDTDSWYLGGLDSQSTFLFFYELVAKNKNKAEQNGSVSSIQYVVKYLHSSGQHRIRVITMQKQFFQSASAASFLPYLDQFNIISTYTKISSHRTIEQESFFVRRYLDKKLISILKVFQQNGIPDELNLLPQYFYYLRKSPFVSKIASSLDEMIFYRHHSLWQIPENILVMVQPQIIEYSLNSEDPVPVLPDIDCLKKDVILLADTYFYIIIWRGEHIQAWYKQEYHKQEGYEYLANLLNGPEEDFALIVEDRIAVPEKIEAWFGSPSERLLKSKLNPEVKQTGSENEAVTSGNFVTEDASLSVFMEKLLVLVNQKDSQLI